MIFIIAPKKIVLASKSAARKSILENLGIEAEIYITDADETLSGDVPPEKIVTELSRRKARAAAGVMGDPSTLIIAADTIVECGGRIIGKPSSEADAAETLSLLSGNLHRVYSGITVVFGGVAESDYDVTEVKFRDLGEREIAQYVKTGDPLTKAGSYGAEGPGSAFVERIEGDFFNVAGLPVPKFADILKNRFGLTVFDLSGRDMPDIPERMG